MKDNAPQYELIIYEAAGGRPAIAVRLEGETVWLTKAQLVELYQSSKANVSEHIRNIYQEGELAESATVRKFRTVRMDSREDPRSVVRKFRTTAPGCLNNATATHYLKITFS